MRRLHPRSAVIDAVQGGLQLGSLGLFGGFFLANQAGVVPLSVALLLAPLAFLLGAGYQVAYYYRFGYELTEEELLVTSGVVGRQRREIPLERIQNVDVSRPAVKRALGLAVVRFETAGGSSTEATLDAVGPEEADRLQRQVGPEARRRREGGEDTGDTGPVTDDSGDTAGGPVDDSEVVYEISDHELRVLSAVSFRPGAFAVPFVGIPLGGEDLVVRGLQLVGIDLRAGLRELASLNPATLALGVVSAAVAYLLAVWLVSVVLTYLQYYGFRLERAGDELRYERGLVGRYSGTIPLGKVQTVRIGENVLMRRLGYAALAVETAGYAAGSNGDGGSETTVPLGVHDDVLELARDVLAASDDTGRYEASEGLGEPSDRSDGTTPSRETDTDPVADPEFQQPAGRAKRRYVRRYLIALGVVCVGLLGASRATTLPATAAALPALVAPLTPLAARLKWRHRGYHGTEWSLVTREGFWRRRTRIVPVFRLQTVLVSRTLFQRRWGLASVTADTASSAGGGAVVYDVDPERAEELRVSLLDRLDNSLAERRRAARSRARARAAAGERAGTGREPTGDEESHATDHTEFGSGGPRVSGDESGAPADESGASGDGPREARDESRDAPDPSERPPGDGDPSLDEADPVTDDSAAPDDETEFRWVDGVDPDGSPTNGHHDDEE
jgi:putative membrane protein